MTYEMSGNLKFDFWLDDDGTGRGSMRVQDSMLNPFGTVHAGALIWFADVVATTAAMGAAEVTRGAAGFPLAINLNSQLFANVKEGELRAESSPVKKGKTLIVMRTTVQDERNRTLIELTSTHMMSR